jgi:peptide chain release factor 1
MKEKIAKIKAEFNKLAEDLQNPKIISDPENLQKIARRRAELARIVSESERLAEIQKRIIETKQLQESEESDELKQLASEELEKLQIEEQKLKKSLEILLLPTDPDNEKDVILEIRAGTGGDEAELFASDLFRMYSRYAETKGWRINILNSHRTGIGGIKEIIAEISGTEPYRFLKYESGVHRVQRIPKTEKSGRVHTSAVSVVVLPEAQEVDIKIDPKDLKIDTFRSSGVTYPYEIRTLYVGNSSVLRRVRFAIRQTLLTASMWLQMASHSLLGRT